MGQTPPPAASPEPMDNGFDALAARIRACRLCAGALPHEPRPVFRAAPGARLLIAGQAPGTRVHASGKPFTDPSGDRLRRWMGIDESVFYDESRVAIVPMGFCFPGLDAAGGDRPPRKECRATWHDALFEALPNIRLTLAIGAHAQTYHLERLGSSGPKRNVTETVADWRRFADGAPRLFPLPHPSWRNAGWLKRHPWFETELLPDLRAAVADCLADGDEAHK